jgi:phosphoribosyl 1,2-cyclic phosphodiesterase
LRFTSLSSGSEGNALVVESTRRGLHQDPTRLLVDCGLPVKEMLRRLELRGLLPQDIDAIFVTHEHGDHVGGVARFARHAGIPVLCSHGTRLACSDEFWSGVHVTEVDSHAQIPLCDLLLHCFPVPHDAREPVQLVVEDASVGGVSIVGGQHGGTNRQRLGVLTDVGKSTLHIEEMLSFTDALFIEANHDEALLANSDYPASLKQRIGGPFGHLSNAASAEILATINQSRLQHVVAAHLSRHNNRPDLVVEALSPVVAPQAQLTVASQVDGFEWIVID